MFSSQREAIEQMMEVIHQYEMIGRKVKGFEKQRERLMDQYNECIDYLVGEADLELYDLKIDFPQQITTKDDRQELYNTLFVIINRLNDISLDEIKEQIN